MSKTEPSIEDMLRSLMGEEDAQLLNETMTAPPDEPAAVTQTLPTDVTEVFTDEEDRTKLEPMQFPTFAAKDIAETLDIRNYATMARLRMRKWTARKKDKRVARNAAKSEGASDQAFSVYKRLLAGAEDKLKAVNAVIDKARGQHYAMTLPWSVTGIDETGRRDGPRMLPNTLFLDYIKEMGNAKTDMVTALDDFVAHYPSLVEAAKRSLGGSFDATEYPEPAHIRGNFALDFDFSPIPTGVDFKGLPRQQIERLSEALNDNMQKCLENAMRDVWQRLHKTVGHMAERLSDPARTFHDTLVGNVREVVALGRHLNATGDHRLGGLLQKAETELCKHEPKTLREDMTTRALVAKCAGELLGEMRKHGVSQP